MKVINLTFHGIGEPGASPREIPPAEIPMWVSHDRYCEILRAVGQRPEVRITFDDGNASDVELALPELVKRGMRATFFVLAGRLGQPGSLGREALVELRRQGMSIGLHGMDHVAWRGLGADRLTVELVDARRKLEDVIGIPITAAGCPFGAYGRHALGRLRDEGFERVYTSDRGPADADAWLQARNTVRGDDDAGSVERICRPDAPGIGRRVKLLMKRAL